MPRLPRLHVLEPYLLTESKVGVLARQFLVAVQANPRLALSARSSKLIAGPCAARRLRVRRLAPVL